jgi:hypothetical protein
MQKIPTYFHRDIYPELVGRPEREDIISQDDVLNLKIALELCRDMRDLFQDRHLF